MDWSEEEVFEFLDYFEEEQLLWNTSDSRHKNRYEIADAWKRIQDKLDGRRSTRELQRKRDSLMASFRRQKNRYTQSVRNASGNENVSIPNWFAYERMNKFLSDKNRPTQILSSQEQIVDENRSASCNTPLSTRGSEASPSTVPPNRESEIFNALHFACGILSSSVPHMKEKDMLDIYGELTAEKLRSFDESVRENLMYQIDTLLHEAKIKHKP